MGYWITIGVLIVLMLAHSTYLRVTAEPQEPWCEVGTPMTLDGEPICAVIEYELVECVIAWHEECA